MNYVEQLNTSHWKGKRKEILERDKFTCVNCQNKKLIETSEIGEVEKIDNLTNKLVNIAQGWGDNFRNYKLVVFCDSNDNTSSFYITELKYKNVTSREIDVNDIVYFEVVDKQEANQENISAIFRNRIGKVKNDKINVIGIKDKTGYKFVKNLHVHHQYYQISKLAWEYPNEALITLCWSCHESIHNDSEIDILDDKGGIIDKKIRCKRCFGAGVFPEYYHIEGGICFRCNGNKFEK